MIFDDSLRSVHETAAKYKIIKFGANRPKPKILSVFAKEMEILVWHIEPCWPTLGLNRDFITAKNNSSQLRKKLFYIQNFFKNP